MYFSVYFFQKEIIISEYLRIKSLIIFSFGIIRSRTAKHRLNVFFIEYFFSARTGRTIFIVTRGIFDLLLNRIDNRLCQNINNINYVVQCQIYKFDRFGNVFVQTKKIKTDHNIAIEVFIITNYNIKFTSSIRLKKWFVWNRGFRDGFRSGSFLLLSLAIKKWLIFVHRFGHYVSLRVSSSTAE